MTAVVQETIGRLIMKNLTKGESLAPLSDGVPASFALDQVREPDSLHELVQVSLQGLLALLCVAPLLLARRLSHGQGVDHLQAYSLWLQTSAESPPSAGHQAAWLTWALLTLLQVPTFLMTALNHRPGQLYVSVKCLLTYHWHCAEDHVPPACCRSHVSAIQWLKQACSVLQMISLLRWFKPYLFP